jgi:hypothetical protein
MDVIDWLSEIVSIFSLRRAAGRLWRDVASWCNISFTTPLAILTGLNCIAGLIFARSQSARPISLNDARLCTAAFGAAALAVFSRWVIRNSERVEPAFWLKALLAGLSVLPFAALFTVATPRNSLLAVASVSALAVVAGNATMLWRRKVHRHTAHYAWEEKKSHRAPHKHETLHDRKVHRSPAHVPIEPEKNLPPVLRVISPDGPAEVSEQSEGLTEDTRPGEWCERKKNEFGKTVVHGCMLAKFEPRQSLANVHIPFQPPFEKAPEFTYQIFDAEDIRARTPAVFRYGARLELKRSEDIDQSLEVKVQFKATAQGNAIRAA